MSFLVTLRQKSRINIDHSPIIYSLRAPKTLQGTVQLPASKSISNRALIIHALARKRDAAAPTPLDWEQAPANLSDCDDTAVIVKALRDNPDVIDIRAAGTAMRFMTAYLAVMPGEHVLTGTERMKHRPIGILVNALRQLGADISYEGEEGFPPLRIKGKPLSGGIIDIPGDMSSQYVSAMLMIGPVLENGLELRLKGHVISRPYIDLTLWMMREFGADADWTSGDTVVVRPTPYQPCNYLIENDWSSASYWYEMMALTDDPDADIGDRFGGELQHILLAGRTGRDLRTDKGLFFGTGKKGHRQGDSRKDTFQHVRCIIRFCYRMFMLCSRIFSSSSFILTTHCWMPAWLALEPVVLISRPISWMMKPSFLPG